MAKQAGPIKITGCYDNICFYKTGGMYYARMKSSLTGKRVKKDPAFRRTMAYAGLLGQASKIASTLYRNLPGEKKEKGFFKKLTGQVMRLLKEGKKEEEIFLSLLPEKKEVTGTTLTKKKAGSKSLFADKIIQSIFLPFFEEDKIKMAATPLDLLVPG
jgi:hypothetical protein